jgi:hypothetical protein
MEDTGLSGRIILTLSDPTSNLVRQYDFPVPLRCRKTSDAGFVAFVRAMSGHVRRFSSCSTDFIQQIAQVVLFLFLNVLTFIYLRRTILTDCLPTDCDVMTRFVAPRYVNIEQAYVSTYVGAGLEGVGGSENNNTLRSMFF